MRNDLTIYDKVADNWWSDDIRWARTLKNLVPGRLARFDRQIDWQGRDVLDLGCSGGFMAEALAARGARVTGIDPAEGAIAAARAHARAQGLRIGYDLGVGEALPYDAASFDAVVCVDVLEHVADLHKVMSQVARVLRPGGTIAITVPTFGPELMCWALSSDYHAPAQPGGHVRIYRRSELVDRMRGSGLEITGHHHAHALHSPYWWLKCAVGVKRDDHPFVKRYHDLLVWDLTNKPPLTQLVDRVLNPILGKSLVVYGRKPIVAST